MVPNLCSKIEVKLENTGFGYALSQISGKYKMIIIYALYEHKSVMRFNELYRHIDGISFKTLSNTLKELEKDNLITRKVYPQIPPKVEYTLSQRGKSLIPIMNMMCDWGEQHLRTQ